MISFFIRCGVFHKYVHSHIHLLLMGDFNFPNIDWCNNCVYDSGGSLTSKLFDITQDLFLTQHTSQPTRHRPGQRSSVLDLILLLILRMLMILSIYLQLDPVITSTLSGHMYVTKDFILTVTLV